MIAERMQLIRTLTGALAFAVLLSAQQQYDIVLKGGHVIDPGNQIDAVLDVAISGGKIAAIQAGIPEARARKSIDVSGLYVVPGLIDLHAHVYGYADSLFPDDSALPAGTTTIVDAGGSGWRTFDDFRRTIITRAKTRVLASINIVGAGMVGDKAESNTADMDSAKTAEAIERNRDVIVGIKTAHFGLPGWTAIDRAVAAGRLAHVPVMVDDKILTTAERSTREKVLEHLRPGDIHTHMFNDRQVELIDRFSGKVQPYILEARRRGVLFDLGHGAGSFLWPVAAKAISQGFLPDTISTDLHTASTLGAQSDMPNCMSKLMLLGMTLQDVVMRSTVAPAKAIGHYPELGTIGMGRAADVAILDLQSGVFAFKDAWGMKRLGQKRLECLMTVRDGKVVFDRDARLAPPSSSQQIYDLLLKNGHVIDSVNHRNGRFDVAVVGNKIVKVASGLPASRARVVIDAGEYYVTAGLIDMDAHFSLNHPEQGVVPDTRCLPNGVTTAVDTGSGTSVGTRSKTRILELPNTRQPLPSDVVSSGMRNSEDVLHLAGMMESMSKLLNLGISVEQLVDRATANPARAIQRPDLGNLSEGAVADIALLEVQRGRFGYLDSNQKRIVGDKRLRCVMTVRNGAILWDSEGLAATDSIKAGPYSNFK